jgi:hypothetical protein
MEFATTEETQRFLSAIWIRWGEGLLTTIATHYRLSPEQRDALLAVLSRPNDWIVAIEPPLDGSE